MKLGRDPPPFPRPTKPWSCKPEGESSGEELGERWKTSAGFINLSQNKPRWFFCPLCPPPEICSILNVIENLLPNFPNALLDLDEGKTSKDGRLMNSGF